MSLPGPDQLVSTIDHLLDHGMHPISIRVVLVELESDMPELAIQSLVTLIEKRSARYLTSLEGRMQKYAEDESWTRLWHALALYRKLTSS